MSRDGIARVDFYFDDWLSGTFELEPELRGALITICSLIWKTGNRLQDSDEVLARWNGVSTRRWRSMRDALIAAGKIVSEDGFIRHSRAEKELKSAEFRREKAREKGAKGGEKKAEKEAKLLENNETEVSTAKAQGLATNTNTIRSKNLPPNGGSPKGISEAELQDAARAWNDLCGDVLPKITKLNDQRRRQLRKRIVDDCGSQLDTWATYCRRIRASPFCCGDNRDGWRADIDFALKPGTFLKVTEGKYDARPSKVGVLPFKAKRSYHDGLVEALSESDDDDNGHESLFAPSRAPALLC